MVIVWTFERLTVNQTTARSRAFRPLSGRFPAGGGRRHNARRQAGAYAPKKF